MAFFAGVQPKKIARGRSLMLLIFVQKIGNIETTSLMFFYGLPFILPIITPLIAPLILPVTCKIAGIRGRVRGAIRGRFDSKTRI